MRCAPGSDNIRSVIKILVGGFIAGTLDIGAAALIYSLGPEDILRSIAGGLLGVEALHAGMAVAGIGLLLQWVMSIIIAAIYAAVVNVLSVLKGRWVIGGVACGIVVFFVMNYVVVPLSAYHRHAHFTLPLFCENLAAMLLFGLIIAYCTRNDDRSRAA
jgi:uncharacterized membrane protein YagU involved in acid resistance